MNGFSTQVDLNILPLGSYDFLIVMDWLEKHRILLNCYDKSFSRVDHVVNKFTVKGVPRKTVIREISALQMKRSVQKGCKVFAVHIINNSKENEKSELRNIPVINEFMDVFPDEIPGLPPKRDIDITIDLVPGSVPISKAPYRLNILELKELKA